MHLKKHLSSSQPIQIQRRRCHIHYMQIVLRQCYFFMKLYLLFWCQQLFLLQRIENQFQVFVSDISMWCDEGDDNLPYSDNSFFKPFFLLDIFETKELDVNELTRWLNILRICAHSTQLYWKYMVVKALTYKNFTYSL